MLIVDWFIYFLLLYYETVKNKPSILADQSNSENIDY